jgi:hypothetical protein
MKPECIWRSPIRGGKEFMCIYGLIKGEKAGRIGDKCPRFKKGKPRSTDYWKKSR